jgi:hypothetical protein
LQCTDTTRDLADVRVQYRVDVLTAFPGRIAQFKQSANFAQGQIERSAVANEQECFDVGSAVKSIIACGTFRGRK